MINGVQQSNNGDARDHAIAALGLMASDEATFQNIGKVLDSGNPFLRGRAILAYARLSSKIDKPETAVRKLVPLLDKTSPREWSDFADAWWALNDKSAVDVAVAKIENFAKQLPDNPMRVDDDGLVWPGEPVVQYFKALSLLRLMKIPAAKEAARTALLRLRAKYATNPAWPQIEAPLKDYVSPDVFATLQSTPAPDWAETYLNEKGSQPSNANSQAVTQPGSSRDISASENPTLDWKGYVLIICIMFTLGAGALIFLIQKKKNPR